VLILIISILSLDFIVNQILDYLNAQNQKKPLPEETKNIYDTEKYKKSLQYQNVNYKFDIASSCFSFLLIMAVIISGAFGKLDIALRTKIDHSIPLALAFFGILFIVSDLLNLPFSIYKTFVIEEKFGFNKTTIKTFITDKIKGYLLGAIVGGAIIAILLYLIISLGQNFWIWFWVVVSILLLLINMFYTSLIVPLFNKLKPLEAGELRSAIEEYSKKISFPLDNIFVIDGSKRSSKANAYFSGIGMKKKIVLYDTLINNHTKEELVAVLAHEVGHFKKKHIITGLVLSIAQIGFMLFILSLFVFNPVMSEALGDDQLAYHLNLIAFGILYTPISHVTGIIMNAMSRKNEYEADRYAATTYNGKTLVEGLKKLSADNLSNLTPHPAYVFVHYSHPPLLERLKALNKITIESRFNN
jgi:STE24 endopeptidase